MGVEVVEKGARALEAVFVGPVRRGNGLQLRAKASRFGAAEVPVLEVEVVHQLAQQLQRTVLRLELRLQHLEGAALAQMGELRPVEVEAQLARPVLIAALASARCPLPMENPLKALTLRPSR